MPRNVQATDRRRHEHLLHVCVPSAVLPRRHRQRAEFVRAVKQTHAKRGERIHWR